ncbi:MAG: acetyl-CoA hydrolase/transferase C-terminal domain-containing protein [Gammaproteobacteria bacterium]
MQPPVQDDLDRCVQAIIERVGKRLVVGTPLGIGKPNHLVNALYQRVAHDPSLHLTLMTALSLERPVGKSELEQRFLKPFAERVFGDYPELDYMQALHSNTLPANIEISEFYFKSGGLLGNAHAQQHYVSSNYTHVVRDMLAAGINVVLQMVAKQEQSRHISYSLSGNPDLTLDIQPLMRATEKAGRKTAIVGLVNNQLPFMPGDAQVDAEFFDLLVDNPAYAHHLFGVPALAIDPVEHMIGLHASTLIKDGGTLQVGIGSLGDAFVYATQLRHSDNDRYRQIIETLGIHQKFGEVITRLGGLDVFTDGLYAGSEMFSDGLLHLYRSGILKRRVYEHELLQKLLNEGKISESIGAETLTVLRDAGVIHSTLSAEEAVFLKHFGILRPDVNFENDSLVMPDGTHLVPDLQDPATFNRIVHDGLGAKLANGVLLHGAFFLGSNWFYQQLRDMSEPERRLFDMTAVSKVNEIFSDVELEQRQHRHARFLNICMKVTLLGAVASDTLASGQVVSGVGGQYNFVAMAHALRQGRSVIMLKSVRREHGKLVSNILWDYAQCTIPRHLRDVVITEYGIAELRGKQDWEVIAALLNISDSRFQGQLLEAAKRAGKLMHDYRIPDVFRQNLPEKLRAGLKPFRGAGLFPDFPFGHEFTAEELVLGKALTGLKNRSESFAGKLSIALDLLKPQNRQRAVPYLKRMGLNQPVSLKERLLAKLVTSALAADDAK